MNINVIFSGKNFVIIKDLVTGYYHVYSYNKPIAIWDGKLNMSESNIITQCNKYHLNVFKEFIDGLRK